MVSARTAPFFGPTGYIVRAMRCLVCLALLPVLAACGAETDDGPDGGARPDAVVGPDAGLVDAAPPDASYPDTGVSALVQRIRRIAEPFAEEGWAPSIAIGLSAGGERAVLGLGRLAPGVGPAPDGRTLYEIGSITKTFTGLALGEMVGRGEVSLDEPVQALLPAGVSVPSRSGLTITLEHLSTHFSGLPRLPTNLMPADPRDPYASYDDARLYAFLGGYTLPRDPGASFEYSNVGVGLLGHALALRAGASSYEALLEDRILGPLGLEDTAIDLDSEQRGRLAPPHDADGRPSSEWALATLAGAGALRSTVLDLLAFGEAYSDRDAPLAGAMSLTTTTLRDLDGGGRIGLGWFVLNTGAGTAFLHDGGTGGYTSSFAFVPSRNLVLVVLSNSQNYVVSPIATAILRMALGLPFEPPSPRPEADVSAADLDRLTGIYRLDRTTTVTVTRSDGRLRGQVTGQPPFVMYAEDNLHFYVRAVRADLVFEQDGRGMIAGLTIRQDGQSFRATRQ